MRFKVLLLILGTLFLSSCGSHSSWFGEPPSEPGELKVHYMKNDSETIQCFKIIDIQYAKFLNGKLSPEGFIKMIDCSELLLLKGASHIELKTKDTFTAEEIEVILSSGVLAESAALERWVKRFVALARVLYGHETDAIRMTDILELFRRIRQLAPHLSKLSQLAHDKSQLSVQESAESWELRKKIFVTLLEAGRDLVKDNASPLVKEILLHQREYFDLGIRQEIWDRFVEACFVVNKVILGRSEDMIQSQDIISVLNILDFTFQKVFDVYGIYATQVWTPKEWVLIIKSYEELLAKFLDVFSETKAQEIKAQDLARILSLIHMGTQKEADTFVSALVDLKTHIFKSPGHSFSRQNVKDLRKFLHEAIEEAHEVRLQSEFSQAETSQTLDVSKLRHLWKSPFMSAEASQRSSLKGEGELELSTLLLHFIDYVIQMHDVNQDGELSIYSGKASRIGELVHEELSALIHTAQKMVLGFKKLMGENALLNSVSQVEPDILGKIVIAVSDKLLVNSDQDGNLNRYEILELLSFMTETDRLASLIYGDKSLKSFRTKVFGEEAVFGPLWIKSVYFNSDFRNYFPRFRDVFLNSGDFKEYVKQYLFLFHKNESYPVTMGEFKIILGLMSFVEYIFLK
ncbi:MAG: hypothetical protein HYY61_06220, partial [Deltaproteobacteria bacterium]|nr:hypothetical protein [Deltaproteobacteria bacterium]